MITLVKDAPIEQSASIWTSTYSAGNATTNGTLMTAQVTMTPEQTAQFLLELKTLSDKYNVYIARGCGQLVIHSQEYVYLEASNPFIWNEDNKVYERDTIHDP